MKHIVLLFLITVCSIQGYCGCTPSYVEFAEINFQQDSINPLKFFFTCKVYATGYCNNGQGDSCQMEWLCPPSFGLLPLIDTIVVNAAYPQAPILIYGGWYIFDSIPSDSLVYATCTVPDRVYDQNHSGLAVQVVLNMAYLAHHTGVKSAYFNAPIYAYDTVGQVLYFDPKIQYQQGDSIWVTLTPPLSDCAYTAGIQYPDQYLPSSHNVLSMYNRTGFLIWDSPPQTGVFEIAYLVSGYRDGVFAYSIMRDMNIRVIDPATNTGINNINNYTALQCYPNPSNGVFTINFSGFDEGDKVITLYNYLGQSVYTNHTTGTSLQVNTAGLSEGVYIVQVRSSAKTETTKVVITQK